MIILLKKFLRPFVNKAFDVIGWSRSFVFPEESIWQWKRDFLFERYEKETTDLFKKIIKPGMVVVDIGAHLGYYTRIFSKLVGKKGAVYAFEADPENFKLLEKNTKHLANVKRYKLAVADHKGTIDFYHCEEKIGQHTTVANVPISFKMRKISVSAADLDRILTKEGVTKTDVIKIDIDGGEPAAFRGMQNTLENNPSIQIVSEFAHAWISAGGTNPDQFVKKIASFGFDVFAITADGIQDFYAHDASDPTRRGPDYVINLYFKRPA